jgi:hypothetical protein
VRVTFTKKRDGRDFPNWVAHLGKRRIEGSHAGSDGRHLPHDIVTLVVERELGIRDGFFGTVASGGVFKSMAGLQKPSRRGAIRHNRAAIDAAEHVVNRQWTAWLAGEPTECGPALDEAYRQWMEVAPGESLTLEFLAMPAHPAQTRRRS